MAPRILIAEDNPEIRQLMEHVLSRDGYEIEAVDNGELAIQKIEGDGFDAVLLDFMMPVASGFDVVDWIEQNRPEMAKSCVIILTAAVRELRNFDTSKVYAAIAKPFDVMQLREVVRECIENKSQPD
jgi:CheY-like chemotaxis protein